MSDTSCPGCGLVLPATGFAIDTRGFRATPECLAARAAHGHLARTVAREDWPSFEPPDEGGTLTVFDVALSTGPAAQAAAIEAWGRSVWATWSHAHEVVREMTDRQLTGWVPHSP